MPGSLLHIKFNPYVTVYSCAIIWSFIAYSLAERWSARRVLIYASARRGDGVLSAVLTQARL